jgi:ketol-acid reductoisomerase
VGDADGEGDADTSCDVTATAQNIARTSKSGTGAKRRGIMPARFRPACIVSH